MGIATRSRSVDGAECPVTLIGLQEILMTDKKKYTGKIFTVNKDRGFGFITSLDPDLKFEKLFFHWTALKNNTTHFLDLVRGMEVEFETIEIPEKGLRAINIDVLEEANKVSLAAK